MRHVRGRPPAPRFRTIQVCPKDLPVALRQVGRAENRARGSIGGAGVDDIRIPSERAFRSRDRALREGLEIDRVVFDALVALRAR